MPARKNGSGGKKGATKKVATNRPRRTDPVREQEVFDPKDEQNPNTGEIGRQGTNPPDRTDIGR